MTFLDWVQALAALTVVVGFAGAILGWIFKKYADSLVEKLVKDYLSELKPNGGSSMRDELKDLQKEMTNVRVDLGHLQGRFAQHLAEDETTDDLW